MCNKKFKHEINKLVMTNPKRIDIRPLIPNKKYEARIIAPASHNVEIIPSRNTAPCNCNSYPGCEFFAGNSKLEISDSLQIFSAYLGLWSEIISTRRIVKIVHIIRDIAFSHARDKLVLFWMNRLGSLLLSNNVEKNLGSSEFLWIQTNARSDKNYC